MKIDIGESIRGEVIKNLLLAHRRIAEHGGTKALIILSRFILKISKQFNYELLELRLEESKNDTAQPPEKG